MIEFKARGKQEQGNQEDNQARPERYKQFHDSTGLRRRNSDLAAI
jgi:hypothetical protein